MANSLDPDEMPLSVCSYLDLHSLLRPVYPNICKNMVFSDFYKSLRGVDTLSWEATLSELFLHISEKVYSKRALQKVLSLQQCFIKNIFYYKPL